MKYNNINLVFEKKIDINKIYLIRNFDNLLI